MSLWGPTSALTSDFSDQGPEDKESRGTLAPTGEDKDASAGEGAQDYELCRAGGGGL